MRTVKIDTITDAIRKALWYSAGNEVLRYFLSRGATVTVFAGGIRDLILKNAWGCEDVEPRDWDIGISGISRKEFEGILHEFGGLKNKYGGFKLFCTDSKPWEIWRQEDTVGLRKTGAPFGIENILRSFVLSSNAIACDLEKGRIYECGALRSIFMRDITILDDAIMHDEGTFAAKALNLAFRRQFTLDSIAKCFVGMYLDPESLIHEFEKTLTSAAIINTREPFTAITSCPRSI
jgi:hypothetical protein